MIQHAIGMAGQIAAGLPLLVVTALISHTQGLAAAGKFTVIAGVGAAVFSVAMWELRSHFVMNRGAGYPREIYVAARITAMIIASLVLLAVARAMSVSLPLACAVIFYRGSDGIIDLAFGFDIVKREMTKALNVYALSHIGKLLVLCIAGLIGILIAPDAVDWLVALSGLLGLGALLFFMRPGSAVVSAGLWRTNQVGRLFINAKWFALATAGSAIASTAPRIVAAGLYGGDSLGAVGISLSIAGFFGIAFFTTWIRYLPQFNAGESRLRVAKGFLLETVLLSVIAALGAYFVLPSVVSVVFGIRDPNQLALARSVLVAAVVFFASMSVGNLYKATTAPWMEFVVYLTPFVIVSVAMLLFPALHNMPRLLIAAGITMVVTALFALPLLNSAASEITPREG